MYQINNNITNGISKQYTYQISNQMYKYYYLNNNNINIVFLKYINNLITSINSNNDDLFFDILNDFNFYKLNHKSYISILELKLMSSLVEIITNYFTTINSLNNQITSLERRLLQKHCNEGNTSLYNYKNINQDTLLKKEYIQYLLLFDLKKSNGVFIETYLNIARDLLSKNNNELIREF